MVSMFLYTIAHNEKNRVLQVVFHRSGETISRVIHSVLFAENCIRFYIVSLSLLLRIPLIQDGNTSRIVLERLMELSSMFVCQEIVNNGTVREKEL
ncbi:hypothetical protein LINPERPRIM_LOCUS11241 [Linum perenne]